MQGDYKSRTETSTEMLIDIYQKLLAGWKDELMTDGVSFGFDSQDIYRDSLDQIIAHNLSFYANKPDNSSDENILLGVFKWRIKEALKLYEKNESFFSSLNRDWLVLRGFRKNYVQEGYKDLPDQSLRLYYESYVVKYDRGAYFKSEFFKHTGFLEFDFHKEIYFHSKTLLENLRKQTSGSQLENGMLLYANESPIFSMLLIGQLHNVINDIVIEPISDFDFFKEINYQHTISKIRIKKGQFNSFYYVIHKLSEIIENKEIWLKNILKDFDIKEKTYRSKYRFIINGEAGIKSKELSERIDEVFREFVTI